MSKNDPDGFATAMEEIGKTDLEELSGLLKHGSYGIVDGVSGKSNFIKRQQLLLETTTGMKLNEIKSEHTRLGRGCKRKKWNIS